MIKILIVDDNAYKVQKILDVVRVFPELRTEDVDTAADTVTAKKYLEEKHYDLLIFDLSLPIRFGEDAQRNGGLALMREIKNSMKMIKPYHIIGLTAYKELKEEFSRDFLYNLWLIIDYTEDTDEWKQQLVNKIKYLIQSKRELKDMLTGNYYFDIAIVTALHDPELKSILNLPANWEKYSYTNDPSTYYHGIFVKGERQLKVVTSSCPQMGMTSSAVLAMKLINNYRPRYLAISGIAAGVKGSANVGDILIPDLCWDYGSGKNY